jgi:PAS domain S-box-containing protein
MSSRIRIHLSFGIALLILALVSVAAYRNIRELGAQARMVEQTHEVLQQTGRTFRLVIEVRAGGRGYALTGQPSLLEAYRLARQELPQSVARLRRLTADNPAQQRRLDALELLLAQRLEFSAEIIGSRDTGGIEASARLVATGRGEHLTGQIRALLLEMESEENRLLAAGQEAILGHTRDTFFIIAAGLLVAFLIVPAASFITTREIARRTRAEQELRQSEAKTRAVLQLLDATHDGVFIFDPTSLRFSYVNQGAIEQTGYTREELLRMTPLDIKPEFDMPRFRAMLAPLLEGRQGAHTFRTVHRRKDGADVPVEITLQCIAPEGGARCCVALVRDITERKRAAEALLFNQQRLAGVEAREKKVIQDARAYAENIVDTVRQSLLVLDADLRVMSANRAFYQTFKVTPQETEGVLIYELGDGQWNFPGLRHLLEEILPQNSYFYDFEVEHDFPAIGRRTMLLNARKTFRVGNNTQSILLAIEDITERKKAEEAILRAKEEVERASKFKDQFLSTMSHELRTPLNAILGFSELLTDDRYGPLNERQRRYLQHVHTGGQHLLRLINDILDLSKIEAGRIELAIEDVDVHQAFAEVLSALHPLADKKAQRLAADGEARLAVRADPTRFKQVLMNLTGNAIKFTPHGGEIRLVARAENGRVRLEVRDTGLGIAPEDQKRIFEAFIRLRRSGEPSEGTGLGLAITQRLVELQGGQLGLESEPGRGSCFYFTLLARPLPAEVRPAPEPRAATEKPPLILIIEDDEVTAKLIAAQLASAGYRVEVCMQPTQAVEAAAELQPDAITLDIIMQPVNGWETLVQLKNDPRTTQIPVTVVTVLDQPGLGATLGADEYLVKPVDKAALLAAVARCLDVHRRGLPPHPILVVEDDAATCEIICEMLANSGFAVASAADGAEARRWMAATQPALVILDLLLPKVSGFDLLAEWRADPRTAEIPVFVLTGKDLTLQEEDYLRQHAEALLRKQQPWQQALLDELERMFASRARATR